MLFISNQADIKAVDGEDICRKGFYALKKGTKPL